MGVGGGREDVAVSRVASGGELGGGNYSRCAGFSRSIQTVSCLPLISSMSVWLITLYGPLYGCCRGFHTALLRTKMCEADESMSLT